MELLLIAGFALSCLATVAPTETQAQPSPELYNKVSADTSKNQDTVVVTFLQMDSKVTSLTATVDRLTGTIVPTGSYAILQGRTFGTWYPIDTLFVLNQAQTQKVFPTPTLPYYDYRMFYITPSSTQTSKITFSYTRRPDK